MATTMKDLKKTGRTWLTAAALILVGILVGNAIPNDSATPTVVTGTISSVGPGSASTLATFMLTPKSGTGKRYVITDQTKWQDSKGGWRQAGVPSCLAGLAAKTASTGSAKPGQATSSATIGVINVDAADGAPGASQLVVWVKCGS